MSERVRFLGYLPDDELEGLWRLAACAAFPTLGEGFGLPVLEAMARGVPVACCDLPVLREVGGDVPHYFPPGRRGAPRRRDRGRVGGPRRAARGPRAGRALLLGGGRAGHPRGLRAGARGGRR